MFDHLNDIKRNWEEVEAGGGGGEYEGKMTFSYFGKKLINFY